MLEMNFLKVMETYVFMKDTFRIFLENPLAFLACLGYARSKENALIVCLNRFRKNDACRGYRAADKEEAFMKFGHFDDARTKNMSSPPRSTPLPWINYLGSEDFFSLVSNTAGGYSFYRDARMRRLTRYRYNSSPLDMDGHHIYIKDGDTVWNPGLAAHQDRAGQLQPAATVWAIPFWRVRRTVFPLAQELFVPTGDACELDRLTLKNKTDAIKELDVFSYVEFCLWDAIDDSSNFQRNFSTGEVEVEPAIIYHKTEYRERRNHYAVFWSNTPVDQL